MGKYDFRLNGDDEIRFNQLLDELKMRKSSLIRMLIREGMLAVIDKTPLEKFEFDQIHGWEITERQPASDRAAYRDLEGFYHIPFGLVKKPDGPSVLDLVKIRDRGECRKCSAKENLQLYHVDGDKSNNTIENLITLCVPCIKSAQKFILTKEVRKLFAVWFYLGRDDI